MGMQLWPVSLQWSASRPSQPQTPWHSTDSDPKPSVTVCCGQSCLRLRKFGSTGLQRECIRYRPPHEGLPKQSRSRAARHVCLREGLPKQSLLKQGLHRWTGALIMYILRSQNTHNKQPSPAVPKGARPCTNRGFPLACVLLPAHSKNQHQSALHMVCSSMRSAVAWRKQPQMPVSNDPCCKRCLMVCASSDNL